jgi:hypothetical protein
MIDERFGYRSGEAAIQDSLGRQPQEMNPRRQALKVRFSVLPDRTSYEPLFSRAFSAKRVYYLDFQGCAP